MLGTIPNPRSGAFTQEHTVPVPALCPVSGNPAAGSVLRIAYSNTTALLDVTTLPAFIASFVGSREMRDLEAVTWAVAREAAAVLGASVTARGVFVLRDGQTLDTMVIAGRD